MKSMYVEQINTPTFGVTFGVNNFFQNFLKSSIEPGPVLLQPCPNEDESLVKWCSAH
jgi:hypothetical protein